MAVLIENNRGCSPCQHLDELKRMYRVLTKTVKVKHGRGRNIRYTETLKYKNSSDIVARENLIYSIKIYEERCLNSENTKRI
jgi:hypothetical protein